MAGNIIELVDLTKKYGSFTAVDSLNLSIRKSEIFGLLGPNGAGKSTTILMMLGLTEPTSGSVSVCGINPTVHPIEVKRKIGYLPEDVGFYYNRTARENLLFTARLNSLTDREANRSIDQLLARVGLSDAADKKTGKYSRGMLQRLGLADVLIKNPEVIILDEPTLGIDPTGVKEFLDLIVELSREEGITVLFSSHDLHHVQQVCDRVGLFVSGKLLAEGDIQTLSGKLFSKSPVVIEARLALNGGDNPHAGEKLQVAGQADAGGQLKAGLQMNAGGLPDAGVQLNAGGLPDAGGSPDAGLQLNAGGLPDAGVQPDAGGSPDAGVQLNAGGLPDDNQIYTVEWMHKILHKVEGINDIQYTNEVFEIGCSRDASAEIAQAIVASGAGLNYLNKKEYGLKDIYYRYFEGGEEDE